MHGQQVSELQALLHLVQQAVQTASSLTRKLGVNIEKMLKSVQEPLDDLTSLLAVCVPSPDTGRLVTIATWLKSRKKVESIRHRFSRAHSNINTVLTALSCISGYVPGPRSHPS